MVELLIFMFVIIILILLMAYGKTLLIISILYLKNSFFHFDNKQSLKFCKDDSNIIEVKKRCMQDESIGYNINITMIDEFALSNARDRHKFKLISIKLCQMKEMSFIFLDIFNQLEILLNTDRLL